MCEGILSHETKIPDSYFWSSPLRDLFGYHCCTQPFAPRCLTVVVTSLTAICCSPPLQSPTYFTYCRFTSRPRDTSCISVDVLRLERRECPTFGISSPASSLSGCEYTSSGACSRSCMERLSILGGEWKGCSGRAQNHILISSSETADGVSTPDSVMMPEIRSGG
jgi:hypothetical protein